MFSFLVIILLAISAIFILALVGSVDKLTKESIQRSEELIAEMRQFRKMVEYECGLLREDDEETEHNNIRH